MGLNRDILMSVVAWDGKHLVADNQVTHGTVPHRIKKVVRFVRSGITIGAGFVGGAAEGLALVEWYKAGADPELMPMYPDTELIVCTANQCLSYTEGIATPMRILEPYYATGSGTDYAQSALSLGMTARQAVLHAIEHDVFCGMGTTSIKLG